MTWHRMVPACTQASLSSAPNAPFSAPLAIVEASAYQKNIDVSIIATSELMEFIGFCGVLFCLDFLTKSAAAERISKQSRRLTFGREVFCMVSCHFGSDESFTRNERAASLSRRAVSKIVRNVMRLQYVVKGS